MAAIGTADALVDAAAKGAAVEAATEADGTPASAFFFGWMLISQQVASHGTAAWDHAAGGATS